MKEFYVKYWGQAEYFLEKKLGVYELDFWFSSKRELNDHINMVNRLCKGVGTIVHATYEGDDVRYKTIVEMDLITPYGNHHYTYDFGYGYSCSSAEFMFLEGNYACDCNLSNFIRNDLSVIDFPDLDCGDEITIENFKIVKSK